MKRWLLLLALTACDRPEAMTITRSSPRPPAMVDKRDQYALARAIVEAQAIDPEEDPDALARLTKAWQGRRYRWELAYVPALCTHPERCVVAPFDHARFERPIAQGWLPRLMLDEATFRAVRDRCRTYRQCILEVEARLDELRLSSELPTHVTLTDAKLKRAREARADESRGSSIDEELDRAECYHRLMLRPALTLVLLSWLLGCGLGHLNEGNGGAGGQGQATVGAAGSAGQVSAGGTGGTGGTGGMGGSGPCGTSVYCTTVLADAPIAYWRLGDDGDDAIDLIDGQNGQYNGGLTHPVMGALVDDADGAAEFLGNTSVITFGDVFDLTVELSLEAWIKPDLVDATYRYVISKVSNNQEGFGLYIHIAEGIRFTVIGGGQFVSGYTTQYSLGEWHHLVGTWNGMTARLYLNGVEQMSTNFQVTLSATREPFKIGAFDDTGGAGFAGVIDEVAIYDEALPETRVDAHYLAGTRP